ncbi:hypothetical protein ISN44_As12g025330 [Arabidopsis suecica]|uniref:Uncharacterized protein n=1 Tax=Arabidopsis suecica TaxID=45249 RepID=A0A8T1YMI7_ARASU|nr:hypothetical protein ISN44_As12g025330 [Arabidopsis suecica]
MVRTMRRSNTADELDVPSTNRNQRRIMTYRQEVLALYSRGEIIALGSSNPQAKKLKQNHSSKTPFPIYTDAVSDTTSRSQPESDKSKPEFGIVGSCFEAEQRGASFKVPRKPIVRTAAASASVFEVFVDEEEYTRNRAAATESFKTFPSQQVPTMMDDVSPKVGGEMFNSRLDRAEMLTHFTNFSPETQSIRGTSRFKWFWTRSTVLCRISLPCNVKGIKY